MLTKEIMLAVELRIKELLVKHNERFTTNQMRMPIISYDLRGTCAGQANYRQYMVKFNPVLLVENQEHFIKQTVAHEFAHLVTEHHSNYPTKPHGWEWQRFMKFFGVPPKRTHSYDVSNARIRQTKRYEYMCKCQVHKVSARVHNKLARGAHYFCKKCGDDLVRCS